MPGVLPSSTPPSGLTDLKFPDGLPGLPQLIARQEEQGVTKLLFQLTDGLEIETVVLPMPRHVTLCISCQVGCRMGCRFCETGRMGLKRNLEVEEIVAQVHFGRSVLGLGVRNVVFMGMGEPLDNIDAVIQAVRVLTDQRGINITLRHITLSTAGIVPGIQRLAGLNWPRLSLAISLNAPDDKLRRQLMPAAAAAWPLSTLKQALKNYPLPADGFFFIEYVLIRGINDSAEHARQTAAWLKDLPAKVNLIACNPRSDSPFGAPFAEDIERFRRILVEERLFVRLRGSRGRSIRAACGQLGRSLP